MSAAFRVLEVYRIAQRRGPVVVGEMPTDLVTTGTRLILSTDHAVWVEVLGVDLPTPCSSQAGRLAVVVSPDIGDLLRPGAIFEIVNPDP